MQHQHYKLAYLPLFLEDLNAIIDYIAFTLHNPKAAEAFIDATHAAIHSRLTSPESFPVVPEQLTTTQGYRHIRVKNHIVFYKVIHDVMEIHRIIYAGQHIQAALSDSFSS